MKTGKDTGGREPGLLCFLVSLRSLSLLQTGMADDHQHAVRLAALEAECGRLRRENEELSRRLGVETETEGCFQETEPNEPAQPRGVVTNHSPANEKVALFRRMFRGREDVFAMRWTGRDGKSGYSPAALKDWSQLDAKGRPGRTLLPLTDEVFVAHLTGRQTIGVYPLMPEETCWFLAADFDKAGWQEDARAFLDVCAEWKIPAALERSRSGRGGHVWVFFDKAIPAVLARKTGAAILTRAMERRHQVGLDSYDRFFPNQDTMPKGGFGNLIALAAGERIDYTDGHEQDRAPWIFDSHFPAGRFAGWLEDRGEVELDRERRRLPTRTFWRCEEARGIPKDRSLPASRTEHGVRFAAGLHRRR